MPSDVTQSYFDVGSGCLAAAGGNETVEFGLQWLKPGGLLVAGASYIVLRELI